MRVRERGWRGCLGKRQAEMRIYRFVLPVENIGLNPMEYLALLNR
jgi:hypothetical protein